MILRFFLLLVILNLSRVAFGQSNFLEGYIITHDFDTLYGEINNNRFHENSLFCEFKSNNAETVKKYYPNDIYGYRFEKGKYYISKEIDGSERFMEYLINGALDMYFYQDDENDNHYFVSKDSLQLKELFHEKGYKKIDYKQYAFENKKFIGPLSYLTSDYPSLIRDIERIDNLEHQTLINVAKKYHDNICNDEECIIYEKVVSRQLNLLVEGGVTRVILNVNDEIVNDALSPRRFQVLFQQSQKNERLFIGFGLNYEGRISDEINFFTVPISFNYIHPKNGWSPYFGFDLDVYPIGFMAYRAGVIYKKDKLFFSAITNLNTIVFILPYSTTLNFGIGYNLR